MERQERTAPTRGREPGEAIGSLIYLMIVSLEGCVRGDVATELAWLRTEFDGDLEAGGPTLAAEFIGRGLVDE